MVERLRIFFLFLPLVEQTRIVFPETELKTVNGTVDFIPFSASLRKGPEDHKDVLSGGRNDRSARGAVPHRQRGGLDVRDRANHERELAPNHQGCSCGLQEGWRR